jgi:phosphoserine phosphatase RsbU/P
VERSRIRRAIAERKLNTSTQDTPMSSLPAVTQQYAVTVLLVDDQAIIAEAVRSMLATESDISFHYCSDPTQAIEQANAIGPTVILQDLVMPELDGLTLVRFFRANPKTREVPLIVLSTKEEPTIKAQAFAIGANDYLVKLPDKLELLARIRYHSKGYIAQIERNEAYRRLADSQRQLAEEVAQAAKYVFSLLPAPVQTGPVRVDWRFVPSMQLGGDSFGYHWLDDDHFAVYLLDVSGHGVGSSLLSVSALNVLRSQSLPNTDFCDPGQVLKGLNSAFLMDQHDDKYFTIWYGVYCKSTGELRYSGGGHPPALLFDGSQRGERCAKHLESGGPLIGMVPGLEYDTRTTSLEPGAKLLLFSDGVFEIEQANGGMWKFDDFVRFVCDTPPDEPVMDRLLSHVQELHGSSQLEDDFSIAEATF